MINLVATESGVFNTSHAEIVSDIAPLLAIAIEQVQLREQIQQNSLELEERVEERAQEVKARMADVERLNRGMVNLLQDMQAANRQLEVTTAQLKATNAELESFCLCCFPRST